MTVKLLSSWKDQPAGTLYTTDATTEAAMVTAKVATATLTGGVQFAPQVGDPSPGSDTGKIARIAKDPLTGKAAGLVDPLEGALIYTNQVQRFRNSLTAALVKNALANQPLIAPPAWVTGTAYAGGQAVVNGGNAYITSGGTSGATAPTHTSAAFVSDGGCSWWYAGPAFSSAANAPTLSAVTTAPYSGTQFRPTLGSWGVGSSQVSDDSNFFVSGGTLTPAGYGAFALASPTGATPNGAMLAVEFMCDAKQLQIGTVQTGSTGVQIFVDQNDGAGMCPLTLGISGVNNGAGMSYFPIGWGSAKPRHYRVELGALVAPWGFLGVIPFDNISKVWAPTNPNRYRAMFIGDSWFQGATTYPVNTGSLICAQIAKLIGCNDFVFDAIGGTGYLAVGSGSVFGSPQRLAFLAAMKPDVVVIEGGTNDAGNSLPVMQAAVLAYLQAARAAVPNAIIFVSGCNTNNSGPSANAFIIEQAISNAVTAFNDPKIFFYQFSATTAAKAWISGTGTTAAPNASGNADLYIAADQHPSYQGAAYVAYRTANAIRAVANGAML